jgi:hypothetical protein
MERCSREVSRSSASDSGDSAEGKSGGAAAAGAAGKGGGDEDEDKQGLDAWRHKLDSALSGPETEE